jgi:hypothetical protein
MQVSHVQRWDQFSKRQITTTPKDENVQLSFVMGIHAVIVPSKSKEWLNHDCSIQLSSPCPCRLQGLIQRAEGNQHQSSL